jgi:plastocyanin
MRRPWQLLTVGAAVAAAAFVVWTPSSIAQTPTPDQTVTLQNNAYNPSSLTFSKPGATVRFVHKDGQTPHTVTFEKPAEFDSNPNCTSNGAGGATNPSECMQQGDQDVYVTLTTGGTYKFHCKIHESMKGTITVEGAPAPASTTTSTTAGGGATTSTTRKPTDTTIGTLTTEPSTTTSSSSTTTTITFATATTSRSAAGKNAGDDDEPGGVLEAIGVLLLAAVVAALIPAWRRLT